MTNLLTESAHPERLAAIRAHHDAIRSGRGNGVLIFSEGIVALGAEAQAAILARLRAFDDFDPDDSSDTHAIGDFEIEVLDASSAPTTQLVFFRIVDRTGPAEAVIPIITLKLACEW